MKAYFRKSHCSSAMNQNRAVCLYLKSVDRVKSKAPHAISFGKFWGCRGILEATRQRAQIEKKSSLDPGRPHKISAMKILAN